MVTPAVPPQKTGNEKATTTQSPPVTAPPASAPPASPPVATPPSSPEASRKDKIATMCIQNFLRVAELVGANYSHRGYCTKCGWQTFQHSNDDAFDMTRQHVMQHWRDVTPMIS